MLPGLRENVLNGRFSLFFGREAEYGVKRVRRLVFKALEYLRCSGFRWLRGRKSMENPPICRTTDCSSTKAVQRQRDFEESLPIFIACRIVSFSSSSRISSVIRVFQNFVSRLGSIIYLPATCPENTCTPYPSARWISAFRPINHTAFSKATA